MLLAVGAVGTAVTMVLILFVLRGQVALSAAMFVLGAFNASYALSFSMVKDEAPQQLSGIAMGLTNMLIMGIGGLVFQPLIGVLAHVRGHGVPDATTLSVTVVAQLFALAVLAVGARR
jgi:MFS family permease